MKELRIVIATIIMSADNIILNEAGGTDVPVVSADCRVLRLFVLIIGSDFLYV